jgi:predicted nucleic acid-binding protein
VTLLVDTNIRVAANDEADPGHAVCAQLLIDRAGELTAPVPVVVEAAWFIEDRFGADREADLSRTVHE